ncbi:MAG: hypothetical protein ACREKS_24700 [Candidatus Rokuibacteriota bacterium]
MICDTWAPESENVTAGVAHHLEDVVEILVGQRLDEEAAEIPRQGQLDDGL